MVAAPGPPLEALYGDATIVTLAGVMFAVPRRPLGIRPMSIQPAQDRPAQHRNHETTPDQRDGRTNRPLLYDALTLSPSV
jgi:hypothetical protein